MLLILFNKKPMWKIGSRSPFSVGASVFHGTPQVSFRRSYSKRSFQFRACHCSNAALFGLGNRKRSALTNIGQVLFSFQFSVFHLELSQCHFIIIIFLTPPYWLRSKSNWRNFFCFVGLPSPTMSVPPRLVRPVRPSDWSLPCGDIAIAPVLGRKKKRKSGPPWDIYG